MGLEFVSNCVQAWLLCILYISFLLFENIKEGLEKFAHMLRKFWSFMYCICLCCLSNYWALLCVWSALLFMDRRGGRNYTQTGMRMVSFKLFFLVRKCCRSSICFYEYCTSLFLLLYGENQLLFFHCKQFVSHFTQ